MKIEKDSYFDVASSDISQLSIEKVDSFNCELRDKSGKVYKGFLLSETKGGKALTVCDLDFQKSATDNKYQPRLTFRKTDENLIDKKLRPDAIAVRIPFHSGQEGYREFWKMVAFLHKFKDLVDVGGFDESYAVIDSGAFILQFKNKEDAQKIKELSDLFLKADVDEDTIKQALTDTRDNTVEEFRKLLENKYLWKTYQEDNKSEMKGLGEEAVWHHFLKKHNWILGLNADIRFIRDLLNEVEVGETNTKGSGSPSVDILGISDYTVLIELKTPNTNIFTGDKHVTARANTWSFSNDFIDGVSQCLGQKFDWEKYHKRKQLEDDNKEVVDQDLTRTVDPKSIFLIGNKSKEIPEDNRGVNIFTKRDTFQRFRRNNRNIEIVTFDELYERAYFIVHNRKPEPLSFKEKVDSQL